jgi:subtilisin-like proprotein convertase family protein
VTIDVMGNDELGSETTLIGAVTQGNDGTVTFDAATGTTTYTANAGFTGTDTYTYTIIDSNGDTSTANVTVVVQGPPTTATYSYSGRPVAIGDNSTVNSTINVTESFSMVDINIQLNISHTRDSDLDVFLVSASGTRIELFTDVGGDGDNFSNTVLDDDAATSITSAAAPFAGVYRAGGDLTLLEGEILTGVWTLEITDDKSGQTGILNSWSLTVKHVYQA